MCFHWRYQKVCSHGAITFAVDGNLLATLLATAAIFSTLRAVHGLLDDGASQQVAASNFSIILQIVDSEGRLCGP
uniref:Uncharacterized protein n=1 Tax=Lepeophtheirus salmonis TaxID=72036 RepID=A0A0K2UM62_LEPSM